MTRSSLSASCLIFFPRRYYIKSTIYCKDYNRANVRSMNGRPVLNSRPSFRTPSTDPRKNIQCTTLSRSCSLPLSRSLFHSRCWPVPILPPLAVPSPLCLTRRGADVAWSARSVSAFLALRHRPRPHGTARMLAATHRANRGQPAGLLTPPAVCLGSPSSVRDPQSHLIMRCQHGHRDYTPHPLLSVRDRSRVDLEERREVRRILRDHVLSNLYGWRRASEDLWLVREA